jgi:hypothetical protein
MPIPILRPLTQRVSPADLLADYPTATIYACDFHVEGAHLGAPVPGGFQLDSIINIDHHAPVRQMERMVSSTTLALERLDASRPPAPADVIVINHTDCDSVLSSAVLAGLLRPHWRLNDAAIAADHTGTEDALADGLQAVDQCRDFELSLEVARCVLAGRAVPEAALPLLDRRHRARQEAARLADSASVEDGVALIVSETVTDGELFPGLLPDAVMIVISCPHPTTPGRRVIKLRLGPAAPAGLSITRLGITEFDPGYGGRWNAGSNRRSTDGTDGSTDYADFTDYVREVRRRLRLAGVANESAKPADLSPPPSSLMA